MARGKKAEINVTDIVEKNLVGDSGFTPVAGDDGKVTHFVGKPGTEFIERKVTVAFCGVDSDGNPIYTAPKKDGSYPKKYADKIQKSETRTIKLPRTFNVADIPADVLVKMMREYFRNKMVIKVQQDIKTVLAGPEKSIAAIEETIKKMGLSGDIATQVRATLLAGLELQNQAK